MKIAKKILFSLLCIADVYCIYATIGYLVLGLKTPRILGDKETVFVGMFLMSLGFAIVAILLTVLIIVTIIKHIKGKNQKILSKS